LSVLLWAKTIVKGGCCAALGFPYSIEVEGQKHFARDEVVHQIGIWHFPEEIACRVAGHEGQRLAASKRRSILNPE
jgi:hypothetical protein